MKSAKGYLEQLDAIIPSGYRITVANAMEKYAAAKVEEKKAKIRALIKKLSKYPGRTHAYSNAEIVALLQELVD